MLLVAGCGLLRLVLNDGLVLTAVKGSDPGTRLLREAAGPEAVFGSVAELLLGTLAAFAAVHAALALLCALPLVISLQRGLRRAQLLAGTWAAWFRLRPLWAMLLDGAPDVRLPPQPGTRLAARYRLHRRVVEIRDAQLALRPFRDSRAAAEAADAARSAGLTRDERDAVIEAAMIVSALGARRNGAAPASSPDAGHGLPEPGNDLESEADRLLRVSRAVRRSPIVRRAAGAWASRAAKLPASPRQPEAGPRRTRSGLAAGRALARVRIREASVSASRSSAVKKTLRPRNMRIRAGLTSGASRPARRSAPSPVLPCPSSMCASSCTAICVLCQGLVPASAKM